MICNLAGILYFNVLSFEFFYFLVGFSHGSNDNPVLTWWRVSLDIDFMRRHAYVNMCQHYWATTNREHLPLEPITTDTQTSLRSTFTWKQHILRLLVRYQRRRNSGVKQWSSLVVIWQLVWKDDPARPTFLFHKCRGKYDWKSGLQQF